MATSDLTRSCIVKILHCGKGEDVEQVARISKYSLVFTIALLYLTSTLLTCVYILLAYYCLSLHA